MSIRVASTTILALGLALSGPGCQKPQAIDQASASQTLMDLEGQAWAAIRDHQADVFKGMVTDSFVIVSSWGTQDLNGKLAEISNPDFTLKTFTFADMKVILSTVDHAVVAYNADYEFVAGGQEGKGQTHCCSVWANRDNKWLAILHTEAVPAN